MALTNEYKYSEALLKRDQATIKSGLSVVMGTLIISDIRKLPKVGQVIRGGKPGKRRKSLIDSDEIAEKPKVEEVEVENDDDPEDNSDDEETESGKGEGQPNPDQD
jgi:hypothetical protein